jgi:murein DD-endopeptidase MepM/ murein hydrolase activator NlpD
MAPPASAIPAKTEPAKTVAVKATNPVYHTVAKKEGLYSISKKYNASIADIKKWNNLSSDGLSEGMNLIVGFSTTAPARPLPPVPVNEKKEEMAKISEPTPAAKEKPVKQDVVVNKGVANFNGGYFKAPWNKQMINKHITEDRGMAGVFKSTSGWEDGKYYCLHNSAPAGSYIKVTNPVTQKSVYAKVLDLIPDLKQNSGIIIRISNAAASELGANAGNFECTLQF